MKIAVIGYSGAGKSTLAETLARRYALPLLHLDKVQFIENWQERDRAEALTMVEDFLARDGWVIDGTYPGFYYDRRMAEADQILFLNLSRIICFCQAVGRYFRYRGRERESAPKGCREKMDWEFVRWLLWEGRAGKHRAIFRRVCDQHAEKVIVLKNRAEIRRFLASLSL